MARFKPYGFTESRYPLWLERDTAWAYKDQFKMAIIMFFMLLGFVDVFLFWYFGLALTFWVGNVITGILIFVGMIPLWRYAKKWVKDLEGTFYLRAGSDDAGYQLLKEKITSILQEANFKYRVMDRSFQSILGTWWLPEVDIITFTGAVRIAELTFDISREDGLEITLNSLSKFPGIEEKLISRLDSHLSMNPDGRITVRT